MSQSLADSLPGKGPPLEWQNWFRAMGLGPVAPAATLSFTNYDAAVAAAVAGQGVALGRRPLVDALLLQPSGIAAPFRQRAGVPTMTLRDLVG